METIELYGTKIEYNGKPMGQYAIAPWGFPTIAYVDVSKLERVAEKLPKEEFVAFVSSLNEEARSQLEQKGNVIEPDSGFQLVITASKVEALREPLENLVVFTQKVIDALSSK